MVESRSGSTATFWTLEPGHGEWVKSVQVPEHCVRALTAEDDYSSSGQHCSVPVSGRRGSSRDSWFDPPGRVNVEHVGVVQVGEARLLAFVVMAAEDHQRGACQRGGVSTSRRRGHAFNLGEGPKPLPFDYNHNRGYKTD